MWWIQNKVSEDDDEDDDDKRLKNLHGNHIRQRKENKTTKFLKCFSFTFLMGRWKKKQKKTETWSSAKLIKTNKVRILKWLKL